MHDGVLELYRYVFWIWCDGFVCEEVVVDATSREHAVATAVMMFCDYCEYYHENKTYRIELRASDDPECEVIL